MPVVPVVPVERVERELAQPQAISSREIAFAGAILLALMTATVAMANAWALFLKPPWLDEYHTLLVAGRSTLAESLGALRAGGDFNPPFLTVCVRLVGAISGGLDVSGEHMMPLRAFSFGCVWLALLLLYWLLRQQFRAFVTIVSVFAIWSDPLMLDHSFEARFYGPWMLCTMCFCVAIVMYSRHRSSQRALCVGLSSVCLCLVHYFGIFTWALVLLGHTLADRKWRTGQATPVLVSAVWGPLALIACVPFYVGQRSALTATTWIPPVTLLGSLEYLLSVFARALLLASLAYLLSSLDGVREGAFSRLRRHLPLTPAVGSIAMLGLLPLVLVAFSVVVQPSLVERYSIVAMFSGAPVIVFALRGAKRASQIFVLCVAGFLAREALVDRLASLRASEALHASISATLAEFVSRDDIVVVPDRNLLYQLALPSSRPNPGHFAYADFDDSLRGRATDADIVERDVARAHARIFGFPHLISVAALRHLSRFFVVDLADDSRLFSRAFPSYRVTRVAPHLQLVTSSSDQLR